MATADLNGDGKLDIVTASYNNGSPQVTVVLAKDKGKAGTFDLPRKYDLSTSFPTSIGVADINSDGKPDIVIGSNNSNGALNILYGNGSGTSWTLRVYDTVGGAYVGGFGDFVGAGDFNGDGNPTGNKRIDVVTSKGVLLNAGNDAEGYATFDSFIATPGQPLAVGDFNKDGKLDLLVRDYDPNYDLYLLPGYGDPGNPSSRFFVFQPDDGGGIIRAVTVADLNADGNLDIAVGYAADGQFGSSRIIRVATLLGDGNGAFGDPQGIFYFGVEANSNNFFQLAAADFNDDGKLDLVTVGYQSISGWQASVLLGDGTGKFSTAPVKTKVSSPVFAVGDFNGDGYADLAVLHDATGSSQSWVDVLLNDKKWPTTTTTKGPGKGNSK